MQNYKVIIAYDGTDFCGWQVQAKDISVSACLQNAFKKAFHHKISLLGTSRTDAGVHALGQVACFNIPFDLNEEKILNAWNGKLPKSILIRKIEKVSPDFHPHKNVFQKTYYFHLFLNRPLPFVARYGWLYRFIDKVDFVKFDKALQLYVGKHDFRSFCKIEDKNKSTIRTIDNIQINKIPQFDAIQVVIKGKSFLRFQIRRMIGYALDTAKNSSLSLDYLQQILDNPNPRQKLLKADGCGLCLRKVLYKNELYIKK